MATLVVDDGHGGWTTRRNPDHPGTPSDEPAPTARVDRAAAGRGADDVLRRRLDGASSIRTTFPRWAAELGLDARLEGIDLPIHAPAADLPRGDRLAPGRPADPGALVTTHKIDLYEACQDLFDVVDPAAG